MKIEIKNRWNGAVIFKCDITSLYAAVILALEKRVSLRDANLGDASLRRADLSDAKADYLNILAIAKLEVVGLYKSLLLGQINGSTYSGECACLVGTIANVRGEKYDTLKIDLAPDSSRPAERLFLAIRKGDTPENNPVSAIVKEWTEGFAKENGIRLPELVFSWNP